MNLALWLIALGAFAYEISQGLKARRDRRIDAELHWICETARR